MNVIQIFLKTSGSIAELYKDFNLYKGLYRNTQIFVYVPKSILYNEDGFTNSVKTGAILTTPNGSQITTQSYFTLYLQDETVNGIEYSVYTQVMPKIFAQYAGTQTIVVNVSSTDSNESTPQIVAITTSQTAQLIVMNSAYLDQDEPIDPSQTEIIQGQINELGERIDANKTQIEANAANIAENTEDIATNASNIAKNTSDIAEINEKLPDIEQDAADAVEAAKQAAASAEAAQSDAAAAAASANASAASASQANNSAIAANNSAIAAANSAVQIEDMKTTFALKDESASSLEVSLDNATFVLTMTLKDVNGNTLSTQTVDFPIESMVVGISYNEATKTLIFQLQSGETLEVPIDDIIEGLATQAALDDVIDGTTPVAKATEADTAGKVNNALTVTIDGVQNTYDGSEAVSVVINTTSNTDPEAVHFTSQTLNESQQSQARENIGAASVAEMNAGDDKSYYNLGAYDTYVDNGDGTVTVTRKTRYISTKELCGLTWRLNNDNAYPVFYTDGSSSYSISNSVSNSDTLSFTQNVWGVTNSFCTRCYQDGSVRVDISLSANEASWSVEDLLSWIDQNGLYIQAEVGTSEQYTETIIAETPINTLDQNMSDIVRDEVEKTLNLFNGQRNLSDIGLEVGKVYTIFSSGNIVKISVNWNSGHVADDTLFDIDGIYIDRNTPATFVYNTNEDWKIFINPAQNEGNENLSDYEIMLNEGSHAYPYQPYNGAIVHERDLNETLTTLTYIPYSSAIDATGDNLELDADDPWLLTHAYIGSIYNDGVWGNLINVRHRGGQGDGNIYGLQIAEDFGIGTLKFRYQNAGAWSSWIYLANQDWVQDNYLPLTGGTVNGDLNVTGEVEENGERVYSPNNEPPYPVTSVAEKTGDVSLSKSDVGLGNVANVLQYSADNPPPYPVTSVNGATGDVGIHLYAHMFRATCANMTGYVYFYYLSNSPNTPSTSEIISFISTSGFLPASSNLIGPNGVYYPASRIIVQSSSLYVALMPLENPSEVTMQLFNISRVYYTNIV